jgi:UDP-galactose transporter B1
MMNGNSDHKQEGVHQRTMSAEESDEHQALPLLDPNAVIRPLEMDLHDSHSSQSQKRADALKFLFGAGGIWCAYLYYGSLQEDVFLFTSESGDKFTQAWFLQFLEALANVLVGWMGRQLTGGVPNLPLQQFFLSGATQVSSKAFTSLALANGLSFPVATLAKSGKMAPVMAGQLLLSGASYSCRDYLQVLAIIGGTAILSLGKKKGGQSQSTPMGVLFILLSLVMDGVTAGVQKRLKQDMGRKHMHPKPYDFMYYTNLSMMVVALMVSLTLGEFTTGYHFCVEHPQVMWLVIQFALCSAIGSSFIFYTVAHFDPLVCSTVTTTRKIVSVILSIVLKGHSLSAQGWSGVSLAIAGIMSEVHSKCTSKSSHVSKKSTPLKAKVSGIS